MQIHSKHLTKSAIKWFLMIYNAYTTITILQISTWLTDLFSLSVCVSLSLSLWDGQCWIKRTWSLIMHSSVMQPSVATNLETESSPGLLSALLGIYGFPYRWFTSYSRGTGLWTHGQVLLGQGLDLHISPGRPCFHTKPTQKAAVITAGKPSPSLAVSNQM